MGEALVGWLVCPVIRLVIDKAKSFADDRSGWLLGGGIGVALDQLSGRLVQLRTVAAAVERHGSKANDNGDRRQWLQQLKDAVFETDDILDDFLYQQEATKASSPSLVKLAKRFFGSDESLNKLKQMVKRLGELSSSSELLMKATELDAAGGDSGHHHHLEGRVFGPQLLEDDEVIGRDEEVRQMVSWLTADDPADGVPVAAIKGHGGMGKTMLAQLLFQHEAVAKSFDRRAWVQPVGTYSEVDLAKQILQSLGIEVPTGNTSFAALQDKMTAAVSSHKFLLFLDDVWYGNGATTDFTYKEMWKKVLAPLKKSGQVGSKIVVTTRKKIVADLLEATKLISLDGLQFDHIWKLFKKFAFCKDNPDKHPALVAIGEEIAKKLKGLPLAAKVVAQMLKDDRDDRHWKKVLNMEVYDDVSKTLELCYQNLPEHLQPCFAICSIFPKNWRFKRNRLVKIWMALGFVHKEGGNQLEEDVGRDYFDQLVARSFFHVHKERRRSHYYIHDLMHDLAKNVSRYDCARVEGGKITDIPRTVRHLSVTSDAVVQLKGQHDLKRLRTLIILEQSSSSPGQLSDDLLKELKGLRVLDLYGCDMTDLSDKIGQLIHLRYLALCKTITRFPESVTKLFHLQTLKVPNKHHFEKFPKEIKNLRYLRHLDMDRTSTSKVPGISQLVNLQGSIEFHVKKEKGNNLESLNDMNNLRGRLHIKNLDVVESKQEACKAGLNKKQSIKVLELEWNSTGRSVPSVDAEVLEGLEPHPQVEEVHIRRYHGYTSPCWLDTSFWKDGKLFLKCLHLTNCRKWAVLPPLGQLPCLKVLHLKEMCSLEQIGSEFYGSNSIAFKSLEDLEFDDMPKWVEWTKEEEKYVSVFPSLRKLKLLNCPHLIKVPSFPQSVRKVSVENTGFVSHLKLSSSSSSKANKVKLETCSAAVLTDGLFHLQQMQEIVDLTLRHCQDVKFEELHALTSLKRLQISYLEITDQQLGTCLQGLQSLTLLDIVHCSNITTLPQIENPSNLTKFHELNIRQCPQLTSLHSLPSFATLETVLIENCSRVTVESFPANFNSLTSLRKLSIMNCTGLESLPSGFPSSLQVVHLIGCKPTLLSQLQNKDGPEWDKIASIPMKLIH
uniref:NB-ARC domain-containing protein n=1 Tax=Oryza meridionalis TaxID=40149 RepID=A0A0E0DRE4_9ORYZ